MNDASKLIESIYNKNLEVHYNQKMIVTKTGNIPINLKGKIVCPVLNSKITPVVCSKLMDSEGWPRAICPSICENAECYIHRSIQSNIKKGTPNGESIKK